MVKIGQGNVWQDCGKQNGTHIHHTAPYRLYDCMPVCPWVGRLGSALNVLCVDFRGFLLQLHRDEYYYDDYCEQAAAAIRLSHLSC